MMGIVETRVTRGPLKEDYFTTDSEIETVTLEMADHSPTLAIFIKNRSSNATTSMTLYAPGTWETAYTGFKKMEGHY